MNGHINETAPPLVSIGEVKLVQVQIVVWFVRTCEVWILFVLHFFSPKFVILNWGDVYLSFWTHKNAAKALRIIVAVAVAGCVAATIRCM